MIEGKRNHTEAIKHELISINNIRRRALALANINYKV
jgi:hypothetical protein